MTQILSFYLLFLPSYDFNFISSLGVSPLLYFFMYQLKIANINPHNKKKVSIYHYYQYKYMGHPL